MAANLLAPECNFACQVESEALVACTDQVLCTSENGNGDEGGTPTMGGGGNDSGTSIIQYGSVLSLSLLLAFVQLVPPM
jgi:hypothetical protein